MQKESLTAISSFSNDRTFKSSSLTKLQLGSTSKGNQQKWYCENTDEFIKEQFYYQGKYWRDDLVEIIASKLAPLFDFGLGLFEHDRRYEGLPFRDCLKQMQCKPFHVNNQIVIDFLADHGMIDNLLPEEFDLTGVEIPSPKAGSYIRNRCLHLDVALKGVE